MATETQLLGIKTGGMLLVVLAASTTVVVSAGETVQRADQHLKVFTTEAKVVIDAQGEVTAVQPDQKMTTAIADSIRTAVGAWKFAPPMEDGKPVSGVTFVRLGVCAAPAEGGYRMAFNYLSNGPGRIGPVAPLFPVQAFRDGASAKIELVYRVEADGQVVIEKTEVVEGNKRSARAFQKSAEEWIKASKFVQEQVAGQPVATRVSMPIEYQVSRAMSREQMRQEQQISAIEQPSCQAALGEAAKQNRSVALDSPFKLLTSG